MSKVGTTTAAIAAAFAVWMGPGALIPASAQTWPSQPIKFVVPYPPGGGTDLVARTLSERLAAALGQPIVIENRPGANTITGTTAVARAEDGHTIGLITDSHVINAAFERPLPYDSDKDFAPIVHLLRVPFIFIVNPDKVPAKSVQELVAFAKADPKALTFGSLGPGSSHQISMEWFRVVAKIEALIVPYRGVGPALNDVVGGHVKSMVLGVSVAEELIKAGKVRALGVTSPQRLKSAPDVPTFVEQGYPEFSYVTWYGVIGPRSMPAAVVERLNAEFNKALIASDTGARIASTGGEIAGGSAADFGNLIAGDQAKYRRIIKDAGSKAE